MRFLELPSELLIAILSVLDARSIAYSSQVNRFLHALVASSSILCYKQQLFIHKAEDNPGNHTSAAEKLDMLRRQESAWTDCQPGFSVSAPVTFRPGSVYDLSGGVYLLGEDGRQSLRYIELPRESGQKIDWKTFTPKLNSKEPRFIVDFAINLLEHDLITLITASRLRIGNNLLFKLELSLHEFSTGKPHPQAKQTILPVTNSEIQNGVPAVNCEIVGDYLALVTYYWRDAVAPCEVVVYDWKTGQRIMKIEGEPSSYAGIIFLSLDKILLPNILENTLEIWKIPSSGEDPPRSPILCLALFQTALNYNIRYISCRSEPNPTAPNATLRSDRPFHASADDAIVLLHLRIHGIGEISLVTVFVHRDALLKLAEDGPEIDVVGTVVPKPWHEWAPEITFCHDCGGDIPSRWITTTCGQRYVLFPIDMGNSDDDPDNISSNVVVLDFGKANVRKVEQENTRKKCDREGYGPIVKRGPHYLPAESQKLFTDDMVCYLPYVETRTREKFNFNGVLMDEERVIGIKTDIVGHITGIDIVHFG
ncbi:hypothetical protein V5O48_014031 [Marasmius crinis-equi]|uniref:F-box domain-containing protein n=1 Tax=Marasmius crinis-equi TaxID=585013 RepID=A0ABR3EYG2_9AGAR